jgi:purine-nucleoside phosphorylase
MSRKSRSLSADERCQEAAEFIRQRWQRVPRAGIILGSGLGALAKHIDRGVILPYQDIPHFPRSTALGHKGQLVCGVLAGVPVVVMAGRFHFYEGYSADELTLPVWVMSRIGVELLIVSNASGGLNPRLRSGDILAIADHIDLLGRRTGTLSVPSRLPSRSGGPLAYDPELIDLVQELARREGFACHGGVYVAVLGPNYETRAEYRAFRRLGGDVVGMSTVPEVLAARRCGLPVLALSTVTNVACPDRLSATAAEEVVDIAAGAEPRLRTLVMGVLQQRFSTRAES